MVLFDILVTDCVIFARWWTPLDQGPGILEDPLVVGEIAILDLFLLIFACHTLYHSVPHCTTLLKLSFARMTHIPRLIIKIVIIFDKTPSQSIVTISVECVTTPYEIGTCLNDP